VVYWNRTFPDGHTLYLKDSIGSELNMSENIQKEHIVKDFKIGSTRIKICDDYCRNQTSEAVQSILDRITIRIQPHLELQRNIS